VATPLDVAADEDEDDAAELASEDSEDPHPDGTTAIATAPTHTSHFLMRRGLMGLPMPTERFIEPSVLSATLPITPSPGTCAVQGA
jgi:hypothetical protein